MNDRTRWEFPITCPDCRVWIPQLTPAPTVKAARASPGIAWSDQWAFWEQGYPAIMLTDTAPFRYPYYHTAEDTADKLDFDSLARVVTGIESVVAELVALPKSKAQGSAFAFAQGGGEDVLKK